MVHRKLGGLSSQTDSTLDTVMSMHGLLGPVRGRVAVPMCVVHPVHSYMRLELSLETDMRVH